MRIAILGIFVWIMGMALGAACGRTSLCGCLHRAYPVNTHTYKGYVYGVELIDTARLGPQGHRKEDAQSFRH